MCRLSFRHRNSWQDAGRIKLNRSELVRYLYELAKSLKVNYHALPQQCLLFHGGVLEHANVKDFKANLLHPSNIRDYSGDDSLTDLRSFTNDEVPRLGFPIQKPSLMKKQSSGGPVLPGD